MASAGTVLTAAQTNTQMDDATLNPDVNPGANQRQVVHITLVSNGVTINPDNIYDALDSQFGTVASDKGTMSRGTWQFTISA